MEKRDELAKLDFFRGCAVLMVVWAHVSYFFGNPTYFHFFEPSLLGKLGVTAFFVHTSWVLMMSLERQEKKYGQQKFLRIFYLRRMFRIYPLSICAVLITYFGSLPVSLDLGHEQMIFKKPDGLQLLANIFLVQNCLKDSNIIEPLWSLPFEIQMYLTLPFLYRLTKKTESLKYFLIILALLLVSVLVVDPRIDKLNKNFLYWQIPNFFLWAPCFIPGILGFQLAKSAQKTLPFWMLPVLMIFACVTVNLSYNLFKFPLLAFLFGTILPLIAEVQNFYVKKISHQIAKYSYGIYLGHYFAMYISFLIFKNSPSSIKAILFILSLALISFLFYHLIENPFIQFGNSISDWLGQKTSQNEKNNNNNAA